jgi:hypothetical protein
MCVWWVESCPTSRLLRAREAMSGVLAGRDRAHLARGRHNAAAQRVVAPIGVYGVVTG